LGSGRSDCVADAERGREGGVNLRAYFVAVALLLGGIVGAQTAQLSATQPQPSSDNDTSKPTADANTAGNTLVISPPPSTPAPKIESEYIQNQASDKSPGWTEKATVYVTIGLFCIGLWQVLVTRNSAQRQLRAYISMREIFIPTPKWASATNQVIMQANVRYINCGQTPAHKVRVSANFGVFPLPHPSGFRPPLIPLDENVIGNTVGPQIKESIQAGHNPAYLIPMAEYLEIQRGKTKKLFVFGRIVYDDVFGKECTTNFCDEVNFLVAINNDGKPRLMILTQPFIRGNEAT
jgi:hypothetical protein